MYSDNTCRPIRISYDHETLDSHKCEYRPVSITSSHITTVREKRWKGFNPRHSVLSRQSKMRKFPKVCEMLLHTYTAALCIPFLKAKAKL